MPDDLQVPIASPPQGSAPQGMGRPSYRIERQPRGSDPATRRLLTFAGGALALLLVAGGAWTLASRRNASVPVIEADTRPLRVKPENPGGMQVAGAEEPDDATPTLAPAPEAPAPLALRAQVQANRPAPPAPATVPEAAAVPASAPPATVPPATGPSAAAPQLAMVAPRPVPSAAPAQPVPAQPQAAHPAPNAATPGTAQIQLAALDSEDAARAEWTRLQKKLPDLLGSRQPSIQRAVDKDGKAVWRVRTGGFADLADASSFCAKVRAKGAGCSLGTF